MDIREGYLAAAASVADLVDDVGNLEREIDWEGPGIGDWTLRDLLGHTVSSGLREVLTALDRPAAEAVIPGPEAYYALARQVDPAVYAAAVQASTEDARRSGTDLGERPGPTVRALVAQVGRRLAEVPVDAVVTTAGGGMAIDEWLPTRTFELAVHGYDLAARAGIRFEIADGVVAQALTLAARIAVVVGEGPDVLQALTGRGVLPEGFSVL